MDDLLRQLKPYLPLTAGMLLLYMAIIVVMVLFSSRMKVVLLFKALLNIVTGLFKLFSKIIINSFKLSRKIILISVETYHFIKAFKAIKSNIGYLRYSKFLKILRQHTKYPPDDLSLMMSSKFVRSA